MKKLIAIAVSSALLLPFLCLANGANLWDTLPYTITRSPDGTSITSPVIYNISLTDIRQVGWTFNPFPFNSYGGQGHSSNYYGLVYWLTGDTHNAGGVSDCVASTTLSHAFTLTIPPATSVAYTQFFAVMSQNECSADYYANGNGAEAYDGFLVEALDPDNYSDADVLFTITPPPPPTSLAMPITIPAATASSFLAQVSAQLADVGLLTIAIVAIAIPLAFYIIKQLMALVPKARGRRQ
jgi:hypothetical protein